MKENIGQAIQQLRIDKGLKLKELCSNTMSISQLSDIENGKKMPSAEKIIKLLSNLNVSYDEFILFLNDDYLKIKSMAEKRLRELVKLKNKEGLRRLAKDSKKYFQEYDDTYFKHVELISCAIIQLIESNNDYHAARKYLQPIREYLSKIENYHFYELSLICNCLFMFEIESAIFLGERVLRSIEKNYSFYRNIEIACVLLNNLAVYSLDYAQHYYLALKYSKMSEDIAHTSHDAAKALHAKIIRQLAYFKLENGKFNRDYLKNLVDIFRVLEWGEEHQYIQKIINKHEIKL
ncbi:helix-turn-helix domain-containing protein [Bacillus cereus]|uniref:Transcriptional activator, Rgg/GadR/MutR family domain-containing protein n=1 Tax=Bacillus cereus HuA4-10 TaxID=1053206 RepID=J8AZB9_BACCE|nr:Rgg/GadR/MutR family transcriptional regulator [Bacillus cereus]EJQ86968.1 transcriptional activator, Rgg/GadR/MutR family domain-containing protein [Bacillus cereus HuA4-10]